MSSQWRPHICIQSRRTYGNHGISVLVSGSHGGAEEKAISAPIKSKREIEKEKSVKKKTKKKRTTKVDVTSKRPLRKGKQCSDPSVVLSVLKANPIWLAPSGAGSVFFQCGMPTFFFNLFSEQQPCPPQQTRLDSSSRSRCLSSRNMSARRFSLR